MKKVMMLAAVAVTLVSCGGGGGRPNFGDNEFPVTTVGTSSADMQTTYPAMIKGVQDVEIRPKLQGFLTRINVREGQTVGAGQLLFVVDNEQYGDDKPRYEDIADGEHWQQDKWHDDSQLHGQLCAVEPLELSYATIVGEGILCHSEYEGVGEGHHEQVHVL